MISKYVSLVCAMFAAAECSALGKVARQVSKIFLNPNALRLGQAAAIKPTPAAPAIPKGVLARKFTWPAETSSAILVLPRDPEERRRYEDERKIQLRSRFESKDIDFETEWWRREWRYMTVAEQQKHDYQEYTHFDSISKLKNFKPCRKFKQF